MAIVFRDAKCILLDFTECGMTITLAAYCDTLKRLRAIQNKHCGLLTCDVFRHKKACPNPARRTNEL